MEVENPDLNLEITEENGVKGLGVAPLDTVLLFKFIDGRYCARLKPGLGVT